MSRRWIGSVAALALIGLLTACGSSGGGSGSGSSSSGSVSSTSGSAPLDLKVGILTNTSGVLTGAEAVFKPGYVLAAKEVAQQYLGTGKISLVYVQDDGTPQGAVAAATKLIQQDGVKILTGINTTEQALALAPVVTRLGGIWLDFIAQGNDPTGKSCQSGYFRITKNASQYTQLTAKYAATTKVTKWDYIGSDYQFGHDFATGMESNMPAGSIGKEIFVPLGTADYGSYIAQLRAQPDTGLITALSGSDAATFIKQGSQFKLFDKYTSIIGDGFLNALAPADQPTYLPLLPQAVEISSGFSPYLNTPEATAFVSILKASDPTAVPELAFESYNSVAVIAQAAAKAKSVDVSKVSAALAGGTFATPDGAMTISAANHQGAINGIVSQAKQGSTGWTLQPVLVVPATSLVSPANGCKLS